jgi:hypothetical protein
MPSLVEDAADAISRAIASVDQDIERLSRALSELDGGSPARPTKRPSGTRTAAPKARKARKAKRAKKGANRDAVLFLLNRTPGLSGAKIAKELDIASSQVYTLLGTLVGEKKVKKEGSLYSLIPGARVKEAPKQAGKKESAKA